MTIDDEPQVLNAVERDLRERYHDGYRIIKAASGEEALETVRRLKHRNVPVALFLVDQRMPGMSGTEFLEKAMKLYPDTRKVLLTAYADTSGQAGTSARIENYPGFPGGLSGADLALRATAYAIRLGADILTAQEAVRIRTEDPYRIVTLGDGTGARPRSCPLMRCSSSSAPFPTPTSWRTSWTGARRDSSSPVPT